MSARSSSGSWSGAGGAPPDIIDLDKFMRGAVRPPRPDAHLLRCGDKLVVDAGGVDRKPAAPALPPPASAPPDTAPSDSSSSRARAHGKHYSHDSGLSDTSYARRKHRPHRRSVGGDITSVRTSRIPVNGSSDSLRAFRAVCERALLDQQAQIARVAQLCERLTERPAPPPRRRSDRSVTDSSDVSSSSRSTHDQRRKDKHRQESSSSTNQPVCAQTDECKTYKIIMNKLDELNRLFAARARSPPPPAPPPPARRPAPASSGSVSVSDKVVATEPIRAERVFTIRGGSACGACGSCGAAGPPAPPARRAHDVLPQPNVVSGRCTHAKNSCVYSVVECESRAPTGTSGCDPRCGFDLDDPVHRLQAMSATTRRRRARSLEPSAQGYECYERYEQDEQSERRARESSLCALCRGYWRSLTHYLAAQLFCCPEAAMH